MKRTFQFASLGITFLTISAGWDASLAQAQQFSSQKRFSPRCQCGKWTCPACQQNTPCPPPPQGSVYTPGAVPSTNLPSLSPDLQSSQPFVPSQDSPLRTPPDRMPSVGGETTSSPPSTLQSSTDASGFQTPSAAALGIDVSSIASNNRSSSGQQRNLGSGGRLDSAIEFQGDAFGGQSLGSVVSIPYAIGPVLGVFQGGGIYAFDLGNDPNPNDFITSGPLDSNGTAQLNEPDVLPNDVNRPSEPGFVFNGGTATLVQPTSLNSLEFFNLRYAYAKSIVIPNSPMGRLKLAENVSPVPRDRVFMNYSSFNNVPFTQNGITVNRFSPGFEKTFWDKLASLEFRAPFATTLDSNIFTDGSSSTSHVEFGNLFWALKGILLGTDTWAITGGASMTLPTADDIRVLRPGGAELLRISNQSVHLMPFLGGVTTPSANSYLQGILQIDVPLNGNSVFETQANNAVSKIGKLNDFTMLYCDVATGYWIYRAPRNSGARILGVIPTLEAHWNRSLTRVDRVNSANGTEVRGPISEFDNLNLSTGLAFQMQRNTRLAFGYVVPVGNGTDRLFDSELRVMLNRFF